MIWRIVTAVTFMLFCATNSVAQEWVRTGLELHVLPSPPPQPIDEQRVRAQILDGCNSGLVRYADTSAMRNSLTVSGWSDEFRSLASIAAMSDQFDEADAIGRHLLT